MIHNNPADLEQLFRFQKTAYADEPYPSLEVRRQRLQTLRQLLLENKLAIAEAISQDFGHRSHHETLLLEMHTSLGQIDHSRKKLRRWMRSEKRAVSIWLWPGKARVYKQPLGVVGIIVPWNYPLYLAIGPLVSALAAGNRAMIKMSELTPIFGKLLERLVAQSFESHEVAVINGDIKMAQGFAKLPFDHLLFTGSTAVGRKVMAAASANLTPVTLELGGKSPTIIDQGFDLPRAVRSLIAGKLLNSGQTCVAPDYVFVPEESIEQFCRLAKQTVARYYPTLDANPDYSSIINSDHRNRLQGYLDSAKAAGAELVRLSDEDLTSGDKFCPTLVLNATADLQVMQEEIFGPILPVIAYKNFADVVELINSMDRPLALYYFGDSSEKRDLLVRETHSGTLAFNETLIQFGVDDLPVGGIGSSGMGRYHGIDGFNTFSHHRGAYAQSRYHGFPFLWPPFKRWVNFALRLMVR